MESSASVTSRFGLEAVRPFLKVTPQNESSQRGRQRRKEFLTDIPEKITEEECRSEERKGKKNESEEAKTQKRRRVRNKR
jgi:hypothetical protein